MSSRKPKDLKTKVKKERKSGHDARSPPVVVNASSSQPAPGPATAAAAAVVPLDLTVRRNCEATPVEQQPPSSTRRRGRYPPIYQCPHCDKSFPFPSQLDRHQLKHAETRNHQCMVCSRPFKTRKTLLNHQRVHSDARPFECSLCPQTFKWKYAFCRHFQTKHPNFQLFYFA